MPPQWMIPTYGDPLGAVRQLIKDIWTEFDFEKMLVLSNGSSEQTSAQIISHSAQLDEVNPFTPVMPINAASLIPELVNASSGGLLGAMLRPCEMRALIEMVKHTNLDTGRLVTICSDCLGTFPADEFNRRAGRKGSNKGLAQETLQFARQEDIVPYRYRSACQMCISPQALRADINIGVLGLPVRQYLFLTTTEESTAQRLKNGGVEVDLTLQAQHQRVIARLTERTRQTRERVTDGLANFLPSDVEALVEQLADCGDCSVCLETCPITSVDPPQKDTDGRLDSDEVSRWLVSCSGCGVCEQACPSHLPLSIIFSHIREKLADEFDYTPGRSVEDLLPI